LNDRSPEIHGVEERGRVHVIPPTATRQLRADQLAGPFAGPRFPIAATTTC